MWLLASPLKQLIHASVPQLVLPQVSPCSRRGFPTPLICSRDVWLRELISNSNDALEKFRLTSLTKKGLGNEDPLNITVKAVEDEDGKGGKIIITGRFRRNKVQHKAHLEQIPVLECQRTNSPRTLVLSPSLEPRSF